MCLIVSNDLNGLPIFVWFYSFTFLSLVDTNKIQVPLITYPAKNCSSCAILCFPLSILPLLNFHSVLSITTYMFHFFTECF